MLLAPTVTLKLKCFSLYSAVANGMIAVGVNTNQIQAQLRTCAKVVVNIPVSIKADVEMSKKKLTLTLNKVGEREVLSAK